MSGTWARRVKHWSSLATDFLLFVPVGLVIREYTGMIVRVSGRSMEPSLDDGDLMFVSAWNTGRLYIGDVVVLKSPDTPGMLLAKRVAAVQGDEVVLPNGSEIRIPKGHVWLRGDNSSVSRDSRHYGPVSQSLVLGRASFVLYPSSKLGFVSRSASNLPPL